MPIVNVEVIGESQNYPANLAQRIAHAVGITLKTEPRDTWVKVHFVSTEHYAENDADTALTERPLIVSLIKYKSLHGAALDNEALELTEAIAVASDHPSENVHLIYEPPGMGRVVFGGRVAR